jgi:DNA-binding IscR family transcriptional regulator
VRRPGQPGGLLATQDCSVHDVFERVHDSLATALAGTNLAEAAMAAGGPPYPMAVRRQRRLSATAKEHHDIA